MVHLFVVLDGSNVLRTIACCIGWMDWPLSLYLSTLLDIYDDEMEMRGEWIVD